MKVVEVVGINMISPLEIKMRFAKCLDKVRKSGWALVINDGRVEGVLVSTGHYKELEKKPVDIPERISCEEFSKKFNEVKDLVQDTTELLIMKKQQPEAVYLSFDAYRRIFEKSKRKVIELVEPKTNGRFKANPALIFV